MRPNWKIILILTAILIFAFSVALAWSATQKTATPMFTAAERTFCSSGWQIDDSGYHQERRLEIVSVELHLMSRRNARLS